MNTEKQRERVRKHYRENKQYYKDKSRKLNKELTQLVRDIKKVPCMDCGIEYPYYVMDFDHRDPSTKIDNVGSLIQNNSKRKLLEEIAKCDVVCSNCHRERTYGSSGCSSVVECSVWIRDVGSSNLPTQTLWN